MKTISIRASVVALLLSISFFAHVTYAGFGVSPGLINEDRLVPGSSMERVIYLVQGNQDQDMKVKVNVESADIAEWITFKGGNEFVIPAGVQQYPIYANIKIPEGAELGIYSAAIRISTFPAKIEGSQITVALGGKVTVSLTVGNDVVSSFNVKSIEVLDIFEGEKPKVEVTVENTGNVPVAPENSSFELFNKYGEIRLAYGESNTFTKTESFKEGISTLEYPLDVRLGVGEYWGHVKIYDNGKVVKELKTVFNVLPKTFIEKNLFSIIIGGAVLLIGLFAFIFWKKKK